MQKLVKRRGSAQSIPSKYQDAHLSLILPGIDTLLAGKLVHAQRAQKRSSSSRGMSGGDISFIYGRRATSDDDARAQ